MTAAWLALGAAALLLAGDALFHAWRIRRASRVWAQMHAEREQRQIAVLADEAILREVAERFEREHSR